MTRGLLFVVVIASIAGCVAEPAPGTKLGSTSIAPAPEPSVSADQGAIAGTVLDEEQRPLSGVEAAIVGSNQSVLSDGEGKFTLNGLAPGTVVVAVARLGYESLSRRIDVVAGETTTASFVLVALAIVEPYVERFIENGFTQIAMSAPSFSAGVYYGGLGVLPNSKESFVHNLTESVVAVAATGTWDRSAPATATWMYLQAKVDADHTNHTQGKSALSVLVGNISLAQPAKVTVWFYPSVGCTVTTNNPTDCTNDTQNRAFQVAFQQKTTVYTDIFHVDAPSPDYRAGPTG